MRKFLIKGFTLIEVMIVIVLIGIIMMVSMGAFVSSRKSARDGKRKADLEQLRSALEMYRSDLGYYPNTSEVVPGGSLVDPKGVGTDDDVVYLSKIPQDPTSGYTYYYSRTTANRYLVCAHLEISPPVSALDCPGSCPLTGCGPDDSCNYEVCNP